MRDAVQLKKRRFQLEGGEAERWWRDRGWEAVVPSEPSVDTALVCDEVRGGHLTVRRVWHTPLDLRRAVPLTAEPRTSIPGLTVVLVVDGEMTVRVRGDERLLVPTTILMWEGDQLESMRALGAIARIEVTIARPSGVAVSTPTVITTNTAAVAPAALSSLANVILNAEGSPRTVVAEPLRRMLAATIELLVAENATPSFGARPPQRLFEDARTYIETWGHSPTVTASSVAEGMHVSRQYLTRVFGAHGTSIGAELRRHRVSLAERLLAEALMSPHEAATAAGFSSLRAMRRALRESH